MCCLPTSGPCKWRATVQYIMPDPDCAGRYLMLLEDDGKNGAQLIEGANVGLFVMKAMAQKARYDRSHRLNWFRDHESAALILWISWMIQTDGTNSPPSRARQGADDLFADAVDRETEEDRHDLNYFLQEIIVAGFKACTCLRVYVAHAEDKIAVPLISRA
jgi:hypothetical protein